MPEPHISRIIDANFNRAREALRVMEDYARFVRNDAGTCEALKRCRHDLAECLRRLPADVLLAARDTAADVGTVISTDSEQHRADAHHVMVAAAKRLPEALRTIEEYAKTFDPDLSAAVESLRYRAYDLEQRLVMRGDRSARFAAVRVYVIITESLCRRDWAATAVDAIAGGADCLQLREKTLDDRDLLDRARRLAALCREHNALFIVNDRPDIARLSDADGVHLGQTDVLLADARRIVGPDQLIGLSTHTPEQFRQAVTQDPDYIAVGPMFPSDTKPQSHVPGPGLLSLAVRETSIPVVAIGGITSGNAGILTKAGAERVCICSAVIGADDARAATRRFAGLMERKG